MACVEFLAFETSLMLYEKMAFLVGELRRIVTCGQGRCRRVGFGVCCICEAG
jgi:hypothetical protein